MSNGSPETPETYRLLTEIEWEYVARAGSQTRYPWGDDIKRDGEPMANCRGCGSEWDGQTAPVGSFTANAFGLHDMIGNVWELTDDYWYEDRRYSWDGRDRPNYCFARGGSWDSEPSQVRSASRSLVRLDDRSSSIGFRVARSLYQYL